MASYSEQERDFMTQALALAALGRGRVEPNPLVGCLLVKDGKVLGRGHHARFGGPHAEIVALREAGRHARGATVFVTLEPCNHHGKTPPCTEALLAAAVRRVFVAMRDPNPIVAGRGLARLRAAGVRVHVGLLRQAAEQLNAPFITFHTRRRPYVILKWAQSLDGKIATRTGDSKWISGVTSRRHAHELRSRVDAVIVGVETVQRDNPMLTARQVSPRRLAARVVIDPHLRIRRDCRLVRSARRGPETIIVTTTQSYRGTVRPRLERAGCIVIPIPGRAGRLDLEALLRHLHGRGMTNVLVEGGGRTLGAFLDAELTDEAHVFVSPRLIGGDAAPGPWRGLGSTRLTAAPLFRDWSIRTCGEDLWYHVRFESTA